MYCIDGVAVPTVLINKGTLISYSLKYVDWCMFQWT